MVKKSIDNFYAETSQDIGLLGIDVSKLISVKIDMVLVGNLQEKLHEQGGALRGSKESLVESLERLRKKQSTLKEKLDAPQQKYQEYLKNKIAWSNKKGLIVGSKEVSESIEGLRYQISELKRLPEKRSGLQCQRKEIAGKIYDLLNEQKKFREKLFEPVESLIKSNDLIRDGYKLQFKSELSSTAEVVSNYLFSLVKQNSGEFRGDAESLSVIKSMIEKYNLDNKDDALKFVEELHDRL